ncbi:MAG TPA: DHA2 family efflux MFS transporter permease subunit [Solirubrobacteraceae bacterium]|nr:DHA2 family efflux MFS transporter permease subunit [Solirubrobacteraceae bacterium]
MKRGARRSGARLGGARLGGARAGGAPAGGARTGGAHADAAAGVRGERSRKRLTLVACILGSGIVLLDGTVVNVALPTIQRALGGGLAGQQWVVNGYLLTLGSLILVGGSLGDIFGERRVFALGVAGFGAASLACALAPSIGALVAARAVQGVAGALLVPSSLAVIVNTFDASERGGAIGSWTAWGAIAGVLGPLAGGELLAIASWRWIFIVNVPLALACVTLILIVIPSAPPRAAGARRVDVLGGVLCASGLAGPVFALIEQPRLGWHSVAVIAPLLAGVALLALFTAFEARAREPMLPLRLFRRRNFAAGNVQTFAMYAGLAILFFFLVLFLQQVGGYTPLQSGLATLPVTAVMFVLSRRFGALADRFGPRAFMGGGPLVAALGLLLFQRVGARVDYLSEALPALLVFALGQSLTVAPLTAAVLAGAEREAGIASGVNNAVARVAGLLGTAAVGAAVSASFAGALAHRLAGVALGAHARAAVAQARRLVLGRPDVRGLPRAQAHALDSAAQAASLHAFHLGMAIAAALVGLGGLIGAAGIRNAPSDPGGDGGDGGARDAPPVRASDCAGGQLLGAAHAHAAADGAARAIARVTTSPARS